MPTIRLTQLAAEKLAAPPSGRVVYWDRHLPGFGVRITASGAKSWVAMYRVDGKAVMETIGSLAKVPKGDDARQAARDSMANAAAGNNPVLKETRRRNSRRSEYLQGGRRPLSRAVRSQPETENRPRVAPHLRT